MPTGYAPVTARASSSIPVIDAPRTFVTKPTLNVHYPLFFVGAVTISVILYHLRNRHLSSGLVINPPDPTGAAGLIQNKTNQLNLELAGQYTPPKK